MNMKALMFTGLTLLSPLVAHAVALTRDTAPDPTSKAILEHPVLRVTEGAVRGLDPTAAIHRNFPQVIEQNFARMNPKQAILVIDRLGEAELSDLARRIQARSATPCY